MAMAIAKFFVVIHCDFRVLDKLSGRITFDFYAGLQMKYINSKMLTPRRASFIRICAVPFASLFAVSATAANISWTGATDAVWSTGGDWVGGVTPTSGDVVVFDAGSVANLNTTLGTNFSIQGLKITTPGGLITIGGGNTLTLGAGGIDMSAASQDLLLNALMALSADQSWNVAAGRTLTANGIISGTNVNLNKIGLGDLILGGANTFTGTTTIGGGTLTLSGSLNGTTGTDLTLAGTGTFNVSAASGVSQGMKVLRFSGGDGTVRSTNNGGTSTVSFTSRITRVAGATGNFSLINGTQGAGGTNNITIGGELTAQLLDRGLFYNGSRYAAYDAGGFVRGLIYGADANAPSSIASGLTLGVNDATLNVDISGNITAQTTASVNTISDTGVFNITLAGSQTLSLNGFLKSGGNAATISGGTGITTTAANNEMVIRTDAAGDTLTISTPVLANGTSSLTKSGAGTLVLSGANRFTGGTIINAGIVQAGSTTAFGGATGVEGVLTFSPGSTGVVRLNGQNNTIGGLNTGAPVGAPAIENGTVGNATLTVGIAASNAYAGVLRDGSAGTLLLTKSGAGTLTLSGANTYTGATTISGGILKAGIASVAGVSGPLGKNSALTLSNSAGVSLDLNGFDTVLGSIAGGGTTGGGVSLGSNTITVGGNNTNTTYAGVISSSAGVTGVSLYKKGTGSLTLQGNNTFTGKIVIDGGTLFANDEAGTVNENKLGATPASFVSDDITIKNGGTLAMLSGTDGRTLAASRGIYLDNSGGNYTQNINTGGGDFVINGVISGPGGFLHSDASGHFGGNYRRLYLNASNTFTGNVGWVANGTKANYGGVQMNNPLALQNAAVDTSSNSSWLGVSTQNLVSSGNAVLPALGAGHAAALQLGGLVTGTISVSRTLPSMLSNATITDLILNPTVATTNQAAYEFKTFTNVIGGTGETTVNVYKTGLGSQALNGANTYSGKTSIFNGILAINTIKVIGGAANSLGQPTTVTNGTIDVGGLDGSSNPTSGTLMYTGTGDTTDRVINLASTTGGATLDMSGTNTLTFSSNLTATGVGAKTLRLQGSSAGTGVLGGQIVNSSNGATTLTKQGTGGWTLNAANTFTGDTTFNGGTLTIGNVLALQNSALNYMIGTLAFSTGINTPTFGGLTGSTSLSVASNVTDLTLSLGTGVTKTYSGTLGSDLPGMNVHKSGAGTQILGAATYTGSTSADIGKLYLNGSNATTAITVAGGATIGGTGTASSANATVADTGIVEAGSGGLGTLTLGGLSFTNTGTINVAGIGNYGSNAAINVQNSNGLIANGTAGSVTITLAGTAPGGTGTVHLIQYAGAIGGTGFGGFGLNASGLNAGPRALFTLANNTGYVDLNYSLDNPVWSGFGNGNWVTSPNLTVIPNTNWKLASNLSTQTNFIGSDAVVFNDTASAFTATISAADVAPASVTFNNTANNYTLQGGFGITGGTALNKSGSAMLTVLNNNSYSGGTIISAGTVQVGNGSSSGTLGLGLITDNGILKFNRSDAQTIGNTIGGSGSVVLDGAGGVALTGPNNYGGNTTLNNGSLTLGNATALGAGTGSLIINGGSLDSSIASLVLINNNAQIWNSDFAFIGTNDLNLGISTVSLGSTVGSRALTVSASTLTVGGVIADGTATGLTKAGAGSLVLGGASTYSGGTVVNEGTVTLNNGATLGANTGSLAVNNPNTGAGTDVVLNLNGSVTTGPLSGAIATPSGGTNTATINIATNKILTLIQSSDSQFDGTIAGAGALTKGGTGKLTLTGTNTFAGGTTLNQGTLSVGSLSNTGTGTITVNGGTFQFTGNTVSTNRFAITGGNVAFDITQPDAIFTITNYYTNASITKLGTGTLDFGGNVYYTANQGNLSLSVNQGTVRLSSTVTDPPFQDTFANVNDVQTGATLKLNNTQGRQVVPTGTFNMSGGTFDLNGNNSNYNPQLTGTGTVTNSNAAAAKLMVHPSNVKTFSGNIVDGTGVVGLQFTNQFAYGAIQTAVWTLAGNNTYSGATTVGVGKLQAGSVTAFSPKSSYTVAAAATLDVAGYNNTIGSLIGAGSVTLGTATLSIGNDNTSPAAFTGTISGVGGSVMKVGSGIFILAGPGTYTGQTIVSQGTFDFKMPAALYNGDSSKWTNTNITVNSGATLGFAVGGAGQFVTADINTLLDGAHLGASDGVSGLLNNASIGFDTGGGDFTIDGSISNSNGGANVLGVQKLGANTLTFTGVNNYSGVTTISAGILQIGNGGTTGNLGSGNVVNNGSLVFNRSDSLAVSNAISGTGSLTKLGASTLALSGASTFTGATTINGGVLSIDSIQNAGSATPNALGNPVAGANSVINLADSCTLRYTGSANGSSDRVVNLSSASDGTYTLDASGAAPFVLTSAITTNATSGATTLVLTGGGSGAAGGAIINGTGASVTSVIKNGVGTWTVASTNTYTGPTNVNAGTLAMNGSISGSTTNVNNGGTLTGDNGTFGNVIVNGGGTFSPGGNLVGTLTVAGDLTLKDSSMLLAQFNSDAPAVDGIIVNGNLNISNGAVLNVSDIGSSASSIFDLPAPFITYSGTWNGGTFLGMPDDSYFMSGGQAYFISYDGAGGESIVTLTMVAAVPEPGVAVSLLGGLGLLLGVRRRRA